MGGNRPKHLTEARLAGLGRSAPSEYALERRKVTIGSASDNDFVITEPTVSRHHAVIRRRFGKHRLVDLESTNGTFVNGRRISGSTAIGRGDEVQFGDARFVFVDGRRAGEPRRVSIPGAIASLFVLFALAFGVTQQAINRSLFGEMARTKQTEEEKETGLSNQLKVTKAELANEAVLANQPEWLWRVNYWRKMAGLRAVSEDTELLPGLIAHARYLVINRGRLKVGAPMHNEDPNLPGFTPQGLAAATKYASDVIPPAPAKSTGEDIDAWVGIPFHRTIILERTASRVGFARYCAPAVGDSGDYIVCAAIFDVGPSAPQTMTPEHGKYLGDFPDPVEFPPDGARLPPQLAAMGGEWPDPLSSCPGYVPPAGQAISLQFDSRFVPKLLAFSVTQDGKTIETCGFDSTTYVNPDRFVQDWGRKVMTDSAEIVLVPRASLVPGATYRVAISVEGRRHPFGPSWSSPFAGRRKRYVWSFSVAR